MEENNKNFDERFNSDNQTNESDYDNRSNENSEKNRRRRTYRRRIDSDDGYNRDNVSDDNNRDKAFYSSDKDVNSYDKEKGAYSSENDRRFSRNDRYNDRDSGYNRDRYNRRYDDRRDRGGYDRRDRGGYDRRDRYDRGSYNRDRDNRYNRRFDDRERGGYDRRYDDRDYDRRDRYDRRKSRYNRPYNKKKRFQKKRRPQKPRIYRTYEAKMPADGLMRLNKYISNSGMCSRRQADDHIKAGEVTVNGEVITELGVKVNIYDEVRVNEKLVVGERKVYVLLNKPKGLVTTLDDPHAKKTVMDLLRHCCKERIYPVGRLDKASTGVLLLTNDGEITTRLTQPKFKKKKIYHVHIDKPLTEEDMEEIAKGVELEDGISYADEIGFPDPEDQTKVGIEIHSGKNRIIRRIFQHMGYKVKKLDRVYFAGLTKKGLGRGKWRFLTDREVTLLKMNAFGNKNISDAEVV